MSRYVLLPYVSYMNIDDEKVELTSIKVIRNEEKQHFEVTLMSHKKDVLHFGIKDMTIQVQQMGDDNSHHKFVISSGKRPRTEFFIEQALDKEAIEKIIKSMII